MSQCKCGCKVMLEIQSHGKDCTRITVTNSQVDPSFKKQRYDHDGYVPEGLGIGGGDDVELTICTQCGQVQDWQPITQQEIIDIFAEEDTAWEFDEEEDDDD